MVRRWWYLALSLSSVVFLEYILLAIRFGPTAATTGFPKTVLSSLFFVLILLGLFGAIPVVRHQWLPLIEKKKRITKTGTNT